MNKLIFHTSTYSYREIYIFAVCSFTEDQTNQFRMFEIKSLNWNLAIFHMQNEALHNSLNQHIQHQKNIASQLFLSRLTEKNPIDREFFSQIVRHT